MVKTTLGETRTPRKVVQTKEQPTATRAALDAAHKTGARAGAPKSGKPLGLTRSHKAKST